MTCNIFYVKDNILKLKRVVIVTNHDLTFIAEKMHKIGPDSIWIGQQVYGLVYDFLNQRVNFIEVLSFHFHMPL